MCIVASYSSAVGTCESAGHTTGCCQGGFNRCSVVVSGSVACYCNEGCYGAGQCCTDIKTVGCIRKIIYLLQHLCKVALPPQPQSAPVLGCLLDVADGTITTVELPGSRAAIVTGSVTLLMTAAVTFLLY